MDRTFAKISLAGLFVCTLIALQAAAQEGSEPSEVLPEDAYPNIGFEVLDPDERVRFESIAGSELCPCPGAPQTLSTCLQDEENRCQLATDVSSLLIRRIKEDAGDDELRDDIVRYLTEAQTPREFDLSETPVRGPVDAPIQIVVFSDFQCPYCARLALVVDMLCEEYGDQIAVWYKHFPLPQHTNAPAAARAAIAAGQQGRFWEMHDLLFENQGRIGIAEDPFEIFAALAEDLSLDTDRFAADYNATSTSQLPTLDREEGRAAGVMSTPTCFINGVKFHDMETFANLSTQISELLSPQ